jgi:AraC family transcriptional regulator of adaptative response/methylated-DNA-[protein]-cysteine methyltransferase
MICEPHAEDAARWQAVVGRDRSADGQFWYGVVTTGIYCRPHCPSRPKRDNVRFFETPAAARRAGLRPCRRCRPDLEQEHGKP